MHGHGVPRTHPTFLDLDPIGHSLERSQVVVLPVPYDAATSFRSGAREGPEAILRASREMEDFDLELGCEPSRVGIHTALAVEPHAGGPEAMTERLAGVVEAYARQEKLVAMLGGDHSLTVGAVRGMARQHPGMSVLVLDAHADLADAYMGSRYSHACVVRRIIETAPAVVVGVRSVSQEAHELIRQGAVRVFPRQEAPISDHDAVLHHLSGEVYVSVDLDALDPGIMGAVGTPEPGGMQWWETLALLRAVAERRRIVGFDLTELAPSLGPPACADAAARLAYKLMGYATQLG